MIERIVISGVGKMGSWMAQALAADFKVAVFDKVSGRLEGLNSVKKMNALDDVATFSPQLFINAVGLKQTEEAFNEIIPYLPKECILSDITSVKNGLKDFYENSGMRYVSTHPMFGPTFGNVKDLSGQNAILITESDTEGKKFFADFYRSLNLRIFEYSFVEHDQTIAYSLSVPFSSSIVFSACMKKLEVPGTTFTKHLKIAQGLLSEDDELLSGILLNKYSIGKLQEIRSRLQDLINILERNDEHSLHQLFDRLRENIDMDQ
jgi:prephenate dehydrogenase